MLFVLRFNDGSALIVAALGANRVRGDGGTALRAIADLTTFYVVVAASLASSAVRVLSFWDGHQRGSRELFSRFIKPRIVRTER